MMMRETLIKPEFNVKSTDIIQANGLALFIEK